MGVEIIRLCRIPVFLSGNIIDLGNYQLQVVEACSGLRYLFPLMSLGFIGAYLYQASLWKKVATVFIDGAYYHFHEQPAYRHYRSSGG